jgi:transcriptional regulator with XRE-family HTH domain
LYFVVGEEPLLFKPERLIECRKKRKLTQEQLAQKVKTTKGTISNYENGHSTPPHETLVAIADVLGVSTDYLLGRTDDPNRPDSINEIKNPRILRMVSRANELSQLSEEELDQALDYIEFLFQQAEKRRKKKEKK